MFDWFKEKRRLNPEQEEAEHEAIQLLTMAQELLIKDDANVDEARKIRFKVTDHLLPPKHLYILGKHPQSLLRDVDKRIRKAIYNITQEEMLRKFNALEEEKDSATKKKKKRRETIIVSKKQQQSITPPPIKVVEKDFTEIWWIRLITFSSMVLFFMLLFTYFHK